MTLETRQRLLGFMVPKIKKWVYRESPKHRDTPTKIKDLALGFERILPTRTQMESIYATILEDHMAKNVHLEEKLEKVIKELQKTKNTLNNLQNLQKKQKQKPYLSSNDQA